MIHDEYDVTADGAMMVVAAGLSTTARAKIPADLPVSGPVIPTALVVADDHGHVHPIAVVFRVFDLGIFIASAQEWASRNGLEYALQSATDQGRAWARSRA